MSWLVGKALELSGTLTSSFVPQWLTFGETQVITTALLAEGGYSYVYSAREVSSQGRSFAVKKVIAQDEETCAVAETEMQLLEAFDGQPGFLRCFGRLLVQPRCSA